MAVSLLERLRQSGVRVTGTRAAVVEAIEAASLGCHITPPWLLQQGRKLSPKLSRATVYRTLDLLSELGLVRPILGTGQERIYIRSDGGNHHVLCSGCGRVAGFEECVADELGEMLAARLGFRIEGHLLEFYGLCPECQSGGRTSGFGVSNAEPGG